MKKIIFTLLLMVSVSVYSFSEGGKVLVTAGGGVGGFDGRAAGTLSASAGINIRPWLEGGISMTAFHTLERNYSDGEGKTFQAESGYAVFYLRPHFAIGSRYRSYAAETGMFFPVQFFRKKAT